MPFLTPFLGGGFPTKRDYRKKIALILTSLLEGSGNYGLLGRSGVVQGSVILDHFAPLNPNPNSGSRFAKQGPFYSAPSHPVPQPS